nr:zinc ribbon domain-containing protein [Natronobeatus ordinarius]
MDDVNPAYTSQRCSHGECGLTHEDDRDGDEFERQKCGKELHSDYNAARNVWWRLEPLDPEAVDLHQFYSLSRRRPSIQQRRTNCVRVPRTAFG